DAETIGLHRIVRLAAHFDDEAIFQMNFQAAKRITKLAGAVDYLVRLERGGLARKVRAGLPGLPRGCGRSLRAEKRDERQRSGAAGAPEESTARWSSARDAG